MSIVAIIPARMASSRFPGKPLANILGLPMVEHVRRRVELCSLINEVVVATCDEEIFREVKRQGGKAIMTSPLHEGCVDRVAEAASKLDADIIINVQGDMPSVHPDSLQKLISPLLEDSQIQFTDMMGVMTDSSDLINSNVVKVVVDKFYNALYYSRESIPSLKKVAKGKSITHYKQYGVNAYRRESLVQFTQWPRTTLENIESIDMLRVLEMGSRVRMVLSEYPAIGVDTPEDLNKAEALMKKDPMLVKYYQMIS